MIIKPNSDRIISCLTGLTEKKYVGDDFLERVIIKYSTNL